MTVGFLLTSAFMLGLLGSTHCVGMCGGIVSVLGCAYDEENDDKITQSPIMFWSYHIIYNLGRILSYAMIGAIIGYISMTSSAMAPVIAFPVGLVLSGLFMILLGLYISDWWRLLGQLERFGSYLWAYIKPLGQRILPVKSLPHAFALGLIWGWLPCGLVYSALGLAAVSLNPVLAALVMMSFGLGTLPMMLVVGSSAGALQKWVQNRSIRILAGLVLIVMGLVSVLFAVKKYGDMRQNQSTALFLPQIGHDKDARLQQYYIMRRYEYYNTIL